MLALYVYTYLLPGRKLPRTHAGPSERCQDDRRVPLIDLQRSRRPAGSGLRGAKPTQRAE